MQASISVSSLPAVQYLLRMADNCLILSQRTSEWSGHAPVLEEDIALSNLALDLIGQARALLTHAGSLHQPPLDEDQLAFLRDERDYRKVTLVELPRGDFAFTVLRNAIMATFCKHLWMALRSSSDAELAGIAAKAVKEARYHQQHAADRVLRLAGGTPNRPAACARPLKPFGATRPDLGTSVTSSHQKTLRNLPNHGLQFSHSARAQGGWRRVFELGEPQPARGR